MHRTELHVAFSSSANINCQLPHQGRLRGIIREFGVEGSPEQDIVSNNCGLHGMAGKSCVRPRQPVRRRFLPHCPVGSQVFLSFVKSNEETELRTLRRQIEEMQKDREIWHRLHLSKLEVAIEASKQAIKEIQAGNIKSAKEWQKLL